tara:strand:- start:1508 stop:1861 length:354 start_codon:yes stop_codon:yes gene_type:complete
MPNFKEDKSKFTMKNMDYYKGKHAESEANSPYNKNKSGSAYKANGGQSTSRGRFRQFRDHVKDDYYNLPRGAHYKGVKQDVIGERKTAEELNPKESMIDMAKRVKAETEAKRNQGKA